MENEIIIKIVSLILQIIGFTFPSAGLLGRIRLKKLRLLNRNFRKFINPKTFIGSTRLFVGNILLVGMVIFIVSLPFSTFLPSLPKFNDTPHLFSQNVSGEKLAFVLEFLLYHDMLFVAAFSAVVFEAGMTVLIFRSMINKSWVDIGFEKANLLLRTTISNSLILQKIFFSPISRIVYYFHLFPIYAVSISPLLSISFVLENKSLKGVWRSIGVNYENYLMPMRFKRHTRWETIKYSMTKNSFLEFISPLSQNSFVKKFLDSFYLIYVNFTLFYWLIYFYLLAISHLTAIVFAVPAVLLYLDLLCLVYLSAVEVFIVLNIILLPYRFFELIRIKFRLRGEFLGLSGFLLGVLGIFLQFYY